MTVRVRLQRLGRRNRPFYRVVVADSRAPRDGKFIELVGTYNPLATRSGVKEVTFKVDRIRYWISVGAQPSDRVAWLLGQFGILPPKVVPVARTKQTVPRKEWKELQKQQAGGKGFHTSAACFSALQPGAGEPASDPLARTLFSASDDGELTNGIATRRPWSSVSQSPSLETGPWSFWWGTGAERETHHNGEGIRTTASGSDELGGDIALDLSRMSLTGRSAGSSKRGRRSSPFLLRTSAFSALRLLRDWSTGGRGGGGSGYTVTTRRGEGCVRGLGWRDAACSFGRRNLLESWPCGGGSGAWVDSESLKSVDHAENYSQRVHAHGGVVSCG